MTSIFCDTCRLSLLEGHAEEQTVEQTAGMGDANARVNLVSVSQMETAGAALARQTEEERLWSWNTAADAYQEDVPLEESAAATTQSTNVLMAVAPARRLMPRRVRIALLIFCVVGVLALTVDGILLTLSILRHHGQPITTSLSRLTTSPNQLSFPPVGQSLLTPTSTSGSAFSLSLSRLIFSAMQGQTEAASQTVLLMTGGQSAFSWQIATTTDFPGWLHLSATQGRTAVGTNALVTVSVQAAQLAPGIYTSNLQVKASDSQGNILAQSPQTLVVTLNVLAPCSLDVTPKKLAFAAVLLSAPSPRELFAAESGGCSHPVTWQVSADASWVTFASSSGTDNGAGSTVTVQASSSGKLIGTYTAHITLQALDNHGVPLAGSPIMVTVTLTVLA